MSRPLSGYLQDIQTAVDVITEYYSTQCTRDTYGCLACVECFFLIRRIEEKITIAPGFDHHEYLQVIYKEACYRGRSDL